MTSEDHDIGYLKGKLEGVDTLISSFNSEVSGIKRMIETHAQQTRDGLEKFANELSQKIEKLATKEEVNTLKKDVDLLKKKQEKSERWWLIITSKGSVWKGIAIILGLIAMQGIYTLVQMWLEKIFN